jgi:thiosulfate/3-mercaptopyruvate sulfurtransferase
MKRLLLKLITGISILLSLSTAFAVPLPGAVVSTDWLQANLAGKNLVIVDLRKESASDDYKKAHIPGARFIAWEDVRAEGPNQEGAKLEYKVPTPAEFEKYIQALGINADSSVVVVSTWEDAGSAAMATRLYWTMKYYNLSSVAVLDGGMMRWKAENKVVETGAVMPAPGNFKAAKANEDIRATSSTVLSAHDKKSALILDARTPDFFKGEKKKDYVGAAGHIPGAINTPMTELIDPSTKRLKSVDSLKALFASKGVGSDKSVIVYCDSGHLSTLEWFALKELAGYKDVKQFDSSLHEWTKNPARPMATDK